MKAAPGTSAAKKTITTIMTTGMTKDQSTGAECDFGFPVTGLSASYCGSPPRALGDAYRWDRMPWGRGAVL